MSGLTGDRPRDLVDLLGGAEHRYFGDGFRHVGHGISKVRIDVDGLTGTGSIEYPDMWSMKHGRVDGAPHASGIDAMVMSMLMVQGYLSVVRGLSPNALLLERCAIKTGNRLAQHLAAVPVEIRIVGGGQGAAGSGSDMTTSRFRAQVANFVLDLVVCHPRVSDSRWPVERVSLGNLEDVLGGTTANYWMAGHKEVLLTTRDVAVDPSLPIVVARVDAVPPSTCPIVGAVEAYRLIGQLVQVLFCDMDDMDRDGSHMLVMRNTEFHNQEMISGIADAEVTLSVLRHSVVNLEGLSWRTARVRLELPGMEIGGSVARRIDTPEPAQ